MEWYTRTDDPIPSEGGAWSASGVKPDDLLDVHDSVDRGYLVASKPIVKKKKKQEIFSQVSCVCVCVCIIKK